MLSDVSMDRAWTRYEPPDTPSFQVADHVVLAAPGASSDTESHFRFDPHVPVPGCHQRPLTRSRIATSTVATAVSSDAEPVIWIGPAGRTWFAVGVAIDTVGGVVSIGPPPCTLKLTLVLTFVWPLASIAWV